MDEIFVNSPGLLEKIKRSWMTIIVVIFTVNILILDFFLLFPRTTPSQTALSENVSMLVDAQNACSKGCTDRINALASENINVSPSIKPTIADSSVSVPTFTPIPTNTPTPTPIPAKTVKEFFVPLGVGTGNSADWTVVEGIGAKIDPEDYGDIKQITLEVTLFIPTGNQKVWIRLYNANTYQSIAGSEISLEGGSLTLLVSSPISFPSGNNLYQIQMKTQLQYPANISMARLRINTK